jgi:hypothetical protein
MRNTIKSAALALTAAGMLASTAPAAAATAFSGAAASAEMTGVTGEWNNGRRHWRDYDDDGYRGGYGGRGHYRQSSYDGPVWRGRDGRYHCRRNDGTTGLLIGGVAGGLLGREVAGRHGDRTAGFLLGAVGGALIGRAIDRNGSSCR